MVVEGNGRKMGEERVQVRGDGGVPCHVSVAGSASRSSAGARRPRKPEWNSDFVEERPLDAAAEDLVEVPKAPARAGRRASSGSSQVKRPRSLFPT
jgi:hypothetical protein